jgi:hypothetical protein
MGIMKTNTVKEMPAKIEMRGSTDGLQAIGRLRKTPPNKLVDN